MDTPDQEEAPRLRPLIATGNREPRAQQDAAWERVLGAVPGDTLAERLGEIARQQEPIPLTPGSLSAVPGIIGGGVNGRAQDLQQGAAPAVDQEMGFVEPGRSAGMPAHGAAHRPPGQQ